MQNYHVKNKNGKTLNSGLSLTNALEWAKTVNEFVVITDGTTEFVGHFGVDQVSEGKTPTGRVYDWNKSHRIGRMRKTDKIILKETLA